MTHIGLTTGDNPCDLPENKCFNGGNCHETPNGGTECLCRPGFDGAHCEFGMH